VVVSSSNNITTAGSSSSSSVVNTFRQRLFFNSSSSCCCTLLRSIYHSLHHRISNDRNLYILSTVIILLPCLTFYICRVVRHLTTPFDNDNKDSNSSNSSNYNHKELANDFGKLSAASLSFLLLPISKYSNLLLGIGGGNGEVHIVRMHIYAGYLALLGGILHGLYYIWIWIEVDEYTSLDDVFPLMLSSVSGSSSNREMHEGHDHDHNDTSDESSSSSCFVKDYNKQCHTKFVNLSGIINGISFLLLGLTSLWYIRRHYYIVFYYVHIVLSSSMLLITLLLHYNKMIWYIGPSILCYIGCNVPVYIEGMYKSLVVGGGGGVCVSKVCCIPDSRGCVELTIVRNDNDGGGGGCDDDDAIGKYVRLTVPEISSKSHPFTAFCDPNHHHQQQQQHFKILFRPIGKFTTQLSKRLESLVTSPELTPSEYTLHSSSRTDATAAATTTTRLPPKMLINGVSTSSNLVRQSMKHDHMIIVAGGVGIVPYINLISSLYKNGMMRKIGKSGGGGQQRRSSYELDDDDDDDHDHDHDDSMEYFDNNGEDGAVEEEQSHIQKTRRVDIHWISRDEGLIRHIVDNYLSFYCHDGSNSNTLSITISIHHTNESSALSISNLDEPATTETTLTQYMAPSESTTSLASPTSLYEGNKRSLLHNVLPTLVFASIAFGGLWIINYCYENIQDKHVMETRPISVIGIIIWSVVVSIASLALVKMTETFSRVVAYTKLDNGVGVEEMDNGNGEIECGEMPHESVSSSDDNMSIDHDDGEAQREGGVGLKNGECHEHQLAVPIAHLQGRPDLRAMFRSAIERSQDEEETNLGVFICGPSMLTDAVSKAIKNSQEQRGCVHNEPRVYIYQEMFEL
jgi:hypothetical protein